MANQSHQELASWCLSNQSLRGRVIRHPTLGHMRVIAITDQGLRVEGHDFQISKNFFFEEFGSLCSPKDIAELRALWAEEERQAEMRAAEEAERGRLAAEQAQER